MTSDHLAPLHLIRPAVRAQQPYVVGGSGSDPSVKLNQNENPSDLPAALKRALLEEFFEIPFNRYPKEQPERLRQALAERLGCEPDYLLLGNGSNELTHTLGLCLIEPGVSVVLPTPMFSLYTTVVNLFGGTPISVPPRPDLHFDVPAIRDAVEMHRPSLTVVTTPNNPTGLSIPLHDVESIVAASDGFVVIDEAYVEFSEEESAYRVLQKYPNLILVRTLSKAYGLAGLRLGYLIAHPDVIREFMKARLPFMIDRLSETVGLAILEHSELIDRHVQDLKRERIRMANAMKQLEGVEVIPGQANFLLFKTPLNSEILMKNISDRGVLVRNMNGYPELAGYLRVNAGLPEENKAFLNALENALFTHD